MLNQQTTEILVKLSQTYQYEKYYVLEWNDLYNAFEIEDKKECKDIWEQLKLNSCVDIKYFDQDEVCFALTSKAHLVVDDYQAMALESNEENAIVKTDSMGRSVVVLPKGKTFENAIKTNKTSLKSFLYGILGGLLGGMTGGGIVYALIHFITGA